LQTDRWRGADFWERRGEPGLTLDALLDRSEVVTVGIDGGGLDDLLGLAVLGRERGTRRWLHWGRAWVARSVLELRKDIAPRLEDFAAAGTLALVEDGSGEDVAAVADVVQQIAEAGLLPARHGIGVDPAGIADVVDELAQRGFVATEDGNGCVVGVQQGWRLSNMVKTCERRLAAGDLVHEGSALMAWVVGNAKVEPRGNALSITKQASGSAKIDPLIALFAAASLMALNPSAAAVADPAAMIA
jgi:phage terminase large subunit-like protein